MSIDYFLLRIQPVAFPGNWPDGELRPIPCGLLINSGCQSNFSRSHEHAPHRSTCTRHSNDAAVPAPCVTRVSTETYAKTYARRFLLRSSRDRPR
ncbi:hypothetical protein, partial [Streptomyces sp. NPDC056132]|uniref:hypothetical protein n=1 Tax=Streptomyces sp. NPDC056132 TaxID=3345722 RepID=UPI0035D86830